MAVQFTRVVESGPGWVKVEANDGNTYTLRGTAAWRANNPGNLRPGSLTNSLGAIGVMDTGSNGKFLVFPDMETGSRARETLLFDTPTYSSKTLLQAIQKYAPTGDNNNPENYASRLAYAAGIDVNTQMADITPEQRQAIMAAQHAVEDNTPGTIMAEGGVAVPADVVQQFSGVPLPPMNIPEVGSELSVTQPNDGSAFYAPRLDADGNYVGSPNRLRQNTYPATVTSTADAAYGVTIGGLGALTDPRTAALMDGPMIDPIGEGPSPIQLLDRHDNERGGLHFESNLPTAAQIAPVPMPGRPASIDAKAAPAPAAAASEPTQTIRVGKNLYRVGDQFDQGGFHYYVTAKGIEKSRIPTGEKTVVSGVIGSIVKEKVAEAAPGVKQALGNAATAVQTNAGQIGEKIGGFFGGLGEKIGLTGAPANGLVVEHVGTSSGRPVLAVSGQAIVDRAPPPAPVELNAAPARTMFNPTSFRTMAPPIQFSFPKTLGEALAGTSYATVASTMDQHFAKTDPIIEDIHDKRETQQVQATKAAPVSTSTVKPQQGTAPAKVAPAPKPAPKMDDVGHPTTWGDFTKTMQVPLPAPAKLAPPAQRTPVVVPARKPSVVVSTPAPTGVGSVRETGRDVKGGHAANVQPAAAPGVVTAPVKTVPQVRELPPVPVKAPTVVAQPTVKTAGAPVPAPARGGSQAAAAAAPIYVDKATGARLAPQTINVYNPDTNQWGQRTVYRPATPSPSAVAQQKADMQSILNSKGFPGSGTSMSV